jgi:hypothetical protein
LLVAEGHQLDDPNTLQPISPNHLLTMKSNVVLPPPGEFMAADVYSRKRWRRVQHLANSFWERWQKEVISSLQPRSKWWKVQRNLVIGDIVLIVDSDIPRCQWRLGKVVETFCGSDNLVRKIKVLVGEPGLSNTGKRTSTHKYLERPINKVILLLESPTD